MINIKALCLAVSGIFLMALAPAMGGGESKEKVPSLANELNADIGQARLEPIPDAEKNAPSMNTTFWDLSSDPNGQVMWPKTTGIGKELKNLRK